MSVARVICTWIGEEWLIGRQSVDSPLVKRECLGSAKIRQTEAPTDLPA